MNVSMGQSIIVLPIRSSAVRRKSDDKGGSFLWDPPLTYSGSRVGLDVIA